MTRTRWIAPGLLAGILLTAPLARAQDVMAVAKDHYKVLVDNEFVRVIENTLLPGQKDPVHTHPAGWFYVTRGGRMRVVFSSGKTEMWTPRTGEAGWSPAEQPHTSENVGSDTMTYVLVEVKAPPAPRSANPKASR